ncbi:MAG: hypothetical protein H0W50_09070 [Parachlamydiaceae bacterium]|nr:hypothetical protein [Parachlamydiaceae bacterium]
MFSNNLSNNLITNVSNITNSLSTWEGISPASTDKLAWDESEKCFYVLDRSPSLALTISKLGCNSLAISRENAPTLFEQSEAEIALKFTDLSKEHSKKLDEIIHALEHKSINDDEFANLCNELNKLSTALLVFRKGLETIIGTNQPLKKPGKHLLVAIEIKLNQIAKQITKDLARCEISNKIESPQLFEIAKFCAAKAPNELLKNIHKFNLSNQNQLFDILIMIKSSPWLDKWNLDKYCRSINITNMNSVIMITDILDRMTIRDHLFPHLKMMAELLKKDDLTLAFSQDELYKIAVLSAQQNGDATSQNIKNFGILDPNQLFDIAKHCAYQNGLITAKNIKKFGIIDLEQLSEIAKICAQQNGASANNIKNFGITNENQLFEIAKLCAQNNGRQTAMYIRNFSITDQNKLYVIAKLCALQSGASAAGIKYFDIIDQNRLIEIAKLCAQKDGIALCMSIQGFGITDQKELVEIAKICAQQNGPTLSSYIKYFDIKDKKQLFEIAKLCAQQNGKITSGYMMNFGLEDEGQLVEIAKICARQDGGTLAENIKNFRIKDQKQLLEILNLCLWNSTSEFNRFSILCNFRVGSTIPIDLTELNTMLKKELNIDELKDFDFDEAQMILKSYSEKKFPYNPFLQVLKKIIDISDPYAKYQNIIWLATTMIFFTKPVSYLSDDQIQWLDRQGIIEGIADFGKPSLRFPLSISAVSLALKENGHKAFSDLSAKLLNIDKKKERWKKLTCLLSALLVSQGVNTGIFTDKGSFRSETEHSSSHFYRMENAQALIEMLILLVQDTHLSANEKEQVLARIIREMPEGKAWASMISKDRQNAYLRNIQSVISIFEFDKVDQFADTVKPVITIVEDLLKEKLACGDVQDFTLKYQEKFKESRNPAAIITYASKIISLNDQEATACFGAYVASTLNGTFLEDRYNIANNHHLQKLSEFNQTFLDNWRKNISIDMDALVIDKKPTSYVKLTAKDWMYQKLITDNHIPNLEELNLKFLKDYFGKFDSQKLLNIEENLNISLKKSMTKRNEVMRDEGSISGIRKCYEEIIKYDLKIQKLELLGVEDSQELINFKELRANELEKINLKLLQLQKKYRVLKQSITKETAPDAIINILENCSEMKEASIEPTESYNKLKLQSLFIQWMNEATKLQILLDERNQLDPNLVACQKFFEFPLCK